eukprot:2087976-Pyramimonas_sp.AAC.1
MKNLGVGLSLTQGTISMHVEFEGKVRPPGPGAQVMECSVCGRAKHPCVGRHNEVALPHVDAVPVLDVAPVWHGVGPSGHEDDEGGFLPLCGVD